MRRLDKKGMSAVTHDEDDSTTLDIIDDSITKKEKKLVEKKRKHDVKKALRQPKPAVKQVVKEVVMSEAEIEANHLAQSLKKHQ